MPGEKKEKKTTRKAPGSSAAKKATKKAARKKTAEPTAKRAATAKKKKTAPKKRAAPSKKKTPEKKGAEKKPVEKTRVVFPRDVYTEHKDEIKAPFKDLDLKWQFLGPGKGRYHKEGVHVFVQHTDAGADFTYWGEDQNALDKITEAWKGLPTTTAEVEAEEKKEEESEAMRLWRLAEPQRRPGEPEGFFRRRYTEWEAQKPGED